MQHWQPSALKYGSQSCSPTQDSKKLRINVLSFSTECLHKHMVLSHLMQWAQLTTETLGYAGVIACVSTHLLLSWFESHSLLPFFPCYLHNNFTLFWTTCTNDNMSKVMTGRNFHTPICSWVQYIQPLSFPKFLIPNKSICDPLPTLSSFWGPCCQLVSYSLWVFASPVQIM